MPQHKTLTLSYFVNTVSIVLGLVLIWRGMWYILDAIDTLFLGGSHEISAVVGIALGFLILYIPDKDLKEIRKL